PSLITPTRTAILPSSSPTPLPTVLSPLSLHDALPICRLRMSRAFSSTCSRESYVRGRSRASWSMRSPPPPESPRPKCGARPCIRSEEHTSELQSLRHLVCRLVLEKKKQ